MGSTRKKREGPSAFNLSFLDIMFCGFGAVMLLVLIVNSQMVLRRGEKYKDLSARLNTLKQEVESERELLAKRLNSLKAAKREIKRLQGRSRVVINEIKKTEQETARFLNVSLSKVQDIRRLESELKRLEREHKRLLAHEKLAQERGRQALSITGQGHRQYLTGLRLGGKRVLILVDCSASMLNRKIVQIIRLKNMPEERKIGARKWRQVVRTLRWLLANLPLESKVRVALFNKDAYLVADAQKRWVPVKDTKALEEMAHKVASEVPDGGTSLLRAFRLSSSISPRPDNIILLTDGLPTLGRLARSKGKVSAQERERLFHEAVAHLPRGVPVNTILFPLEGDPTAPALFWKLAVKTQGSFLTPSSDWP